MRGKQIRTTEYDGEIRTFELSDEIVELFNVVDRLVGSGAPVRRSVYNVLKVWGADLSHIPGAIDLITAQYLVSRNRDKEADELMKASRGFFSIIEGS